MKNRAQKPASYGPTSISGSAAVHQGDRNSYYVTNVYGVNESLLGQALNHGSRLLTSHGLADDASSSGKGIAFLAFDGQSASGMYMLYALQHFMESVARAKGLDRVPKPCEFFDLIGGWGIGG